MDSISVADAEGRLSELIDRVEAGEDITLTRDGKTVARLSAAPQPVRQKPNKPFDFTALKAFTDTLPMSEQSAGDFIRAMRDSDRY